MSTTHGERQGESGLRGACDLPPTLPADAPWPVVLGIDPGTRVLGYGALAAVPRRPRFLAAGVLRAEAQLDLPQRLAWIGAILDELFSRLRPATVVVEQAFSARNVQSALRIGEARGVVLARAAGAGAQVVQYAPAAAKKAVAGNGNAGKEQVAAMVRRTLGIRHEFGALDASDALALALAHVQRDLWSGRVSPGSRTSRSR